MTTPAFDLPSDALIILPWPDPVIDDGGFDPRSPYVQRFWLGILGPSTTCFLQQVAEHLDREPHGVEVAVSALAASLGMALAGKRDLFGSTVRRAITFGMAHPHPYGLQVRRRVPPIGPRHLARLPEPLQRAHAQWVRNEADARTMERARRLASTLLGTGDRPDQAESCLQLLGVPPRAAASAVQALTSGPAAA